MDKLSRKNSLTEAVTLFLSALLEKKTALNTYKSYGVDLRALVRHFGERELDSLKTAELEAFLWAGDFHQSTRSRRYSNLSQFFRWLDRHDMLAKNPMERVEPIDKPKRLPRPLAPQVVRAILDGIPKSQLRDRTMFTLIYENGLRIGEALALHCHDVDLRPDDEQVRVVGKGNRVRTVVLSAAPESIRLLRRHLKQSGIKSGALFRASQQGGGGIGPMDYATARRAWKTYCGKAGVQATIHQLRHTRATELIENGVPLPTVRKLLGHQSIDSTMLYTEVSQDQMRRDLQDFLRRKKTMA